MPDSYDTIPNPYNSNLDRSGPGETPDNGNVNSMPVRSGGSMNDVFINTFIRSTNWSPKKVGFYIDGLSGYAEFTNVYVSGNINALTGTIGGWVIGATTLAGSQVVLDSTGIVTVGDPNSTTHRIVIQSSDQTISFYNDLNQKTILLKGAGTSSLDTSNVSIGKQFNMTAGSDVTDVSHGLFVSHMTTTSNIVQTSLTNYLTNNTSSLIGIYLKVDNTGSPTHPAETFTIGNDSGSSLGIIIAGSDTSTNQLQYFKVLDHIGNSMFTVTEAATSIVSTVRLDPLADATYDIGESSLRYQNLYLSGTVIGPNFVTNIFGDGSDGDATYDNSGTLFMTGDAYYNNLTISTNTIVKTQGYQLFVKGTLTISSGATFQYNANNGSNGSNGSSPGTGGAGGAGGAALASGTLAGGLAGIAGSAGGGAQFNSIGFVGVDGTDGVATNPSLGANGVAGNSNVSFGTGGTDGIHGSAAGGAGGAAGIATPALTRPHSLTGALVHADLLSTYAQHKGSASAGGSGGGGGGSNNGIGAGGGGGGGGAGGGGGTGGLIFICANNLVINVSNGVQANGGNGGVGGNGGNASDHGGGGGGGGGGSGGTGGVIILVYKTQSGSGTAQVLGGTGGSGGAGGTSAGGAQYGGGGFGKVGATGASGDVWLYQV